MFTCMLKSANNSLRGDNTRLFAFLIVFVKGDQFLWEREIVLEGL